MFESNLFYLEPHVTCIPRSEEMRVHAYKLPLLARLDRIAQECTNTARPKTLPIKSGADLTPFVDRYVIKRSHSCGGDHVNVIRGDFIMDWDRRPGTVYFLQELVPALRLGEIRVGVVDGCTIAFRVFTQAISPEDIDAESMASESNTAVAVDWRFFDWDAPIHPGTL